MRWAVQRVKAAKEMDILIRRLVNEPLHDQWCDDNASAVRRSIMDGLPK